MEKDSKIIFKNYRKTTSESNPKFMMHQNPKVTIVSVVYNLYKNDRVNSFKHAVKSLQKQSYKNIEHLIIDGDSNDGTKKFLYKISKNPRVRIISEPDKGIYDAMNKGIKNATGKYIAFLNSDDFYNDKHAIKKSINALEKNNADFSYSSVYYEKFNKIIISEGDISNIIIRMPFCHLTMFTKRSILLKEKGFNEKYGLPADYDLVLRLALKDYKHVKVPGVIATFGASGASTKHRQGYDFIKDTKNIYYDNYSKFYRFHIEQQAIDIAYKHKLPHDFITKFKEYCKKKDFKNLDTKKIIENLEKLKIQGEVKFNPKTSTKRDLLLSKGIKSISKEKYSNKISKINDYSNTNEKKDVGIIIVAYKNGKDLLRCLDSFKTQTNYNFKVYLIDNGLRSEIRKRLTDYNIKHILLKENVGPSTAKNIGVCYAEEDLIAFIDAHCYVNNCYVENVKEIFKDKRKILVRGKILPINCSTVIPPRFYDIGNQAIPIIPTIGGNLVIRKRDFMRIGGFEDPLYGQECIVIAHRMLNFYDYEEEELYYDPRLVLYHDFEKIENKEKEKREKYMLKTILENYQNIQETYDKLDYTLNLITRVDNIKSKEILLHKQKKLENSRLYKILKLYYASKGNIGNIIKFPILAFKILFNKSQSPVSSDS